MMPIDIADFFPNPAMVQAGYVLRDVHTEADRVTWVTAGTDYYNPGGTVIIFGLCGTVYGADVTKPACAPGDNYLWAPEPETGRWYVWSLSPPTMIRTYQRYVDPNALPPTQLSEAYGYEFHASLYHAGTAPFPPTPTPPGARFTGVTLWRPVGTEAWTAAEVFHIGAVPIVSRDGSSAWTASGLLQFQHWDAAQPGGGCAQEGAKWYAVPGYALGACLTVQEDYRWVKK